MATENIGGGGVSSNPNTASSSRSNASADSYIGSLISLTSKSEIRYEGILYNINTEESSIGLRNVRSFGTEGRKKDVPQIPPSDKVYEYILFRGTDIKDLQVKSSPTVQSTTPINNDPAIIQSHFPHPVSSSTNLPSAASGSLSDIGSPMGLPGTNFPGGLPLYQPGGSLGTWGASPVPPTANGSGLAMPMYWQGYYGPPNGLPPHLHQQSLIRPPPGLSMPGSMQQPPQYPNFNTHLLSGNSTPSNANLSASNLPASTLPVASLSLSTLPFSNLPTSSLPVSNLPASTLPEIPSSLHPIGTNSHTFTPTPSAPSTLPSSLPLLPSATLASETLPYLMPAKTASSVLPAANLSTSLPSISPLTTTSPEISTIVPPISSKSGTVSGPTNSYQNASQQTSSGVLTSSSLRVETPTPSLVTPGQLLQPGPTTVSSSQQTPQPIQAAHKDVEVVPVSSSPPPEPSMPLAAEAQPPILPLPVPSRGSQRQNGAHFHNRHGYYGRERGRGTSSSRPVTKFTEEFDFIAMNEKFKKDEVWGHLGKSKFHSKDNDDGNFGGDDDSQYEEDDESAKIDVKPVYNKDDFFDTLSCNALDHESQNGRTKFSEQMKIDTETFGDFSRYRGGRGGRWPPRGGRSRGSYYGRDYGRGYGYGYGHAGRGRGRGMPSRAP